MHSSGGDAVRINSGGFNSSQQLNREERTLHLDIWSIHLLFAEALMEQYVELR
jgi:hypothetical protein